MPVSPRPRNVDVSVESYNGVPVFLGVIDFTGTSKNNTTATTPFNNSGDVLLGKVLLFQTDQDCYILPGTASTAAATTANGVKLVAGERVIIHMNSTYGYIAVIRSSASGNLRVWELV